MTCRTVGHEDNPLGVLESGRIKIPSKMILRRISYDTMNERSKVG